MRSSLFLISALCLLLSSCVPVPLERLPQAPGSNQPTASAYPDVEPSATTHSSLHFALRGYSDTELRTIATQAEDVFNKIGTDTGLYSYLAGQTYTIVVYKDQAEYAQKTKQTGSSRAVVAGNAIYTYSGPEANTALAHHLMHLIFNVYMGEKASSLQWLNEGLAMHEEAARMSDSERVNFQTIQSNKLRTDRMPFSQMTFFVGSNEENRRQEVWYLQTESVVSFVMKQGTSLTFAAFLNELRNGSDLDHAIANNYSGKFRGVGDLEVSWQTSL
jgi:hypothetical protein